MSTLAPFHLAVPVYDLEKCRHFYREIMGCSEGRSSDKWVDFNFFGHQLVIHQVPAVAKIADVPTNPVDGKNVPVPHFGVVLNWNDWEVIAARLIAQKIDFVIEPHIRFRGEVGEQATLFFMDPDGNALEFKAFQDLSQLFAK
jgi:extradiol dioxygenase family protein